MTVNEIPKINPSSASAGSEALPANPPSVSTGGEASQANSVGASTGHEVPPANPVSASVGGEAPKANTPGATVGNNVGNEAAKANPPVTVVRKKVSLAALWAEAILLIAKRQGVVASPEAVRRAVAWSPGVENRNDAILALARAAGLSGMFTETRLSTVPRALWPFLVEIEDQILVVTAVNEDGTVTAELSVGGKATQVKNLNVNAKGGDIPRRILVVQPVEHRVDERVSDYAPRQGKDWLSDLFSKNRKLFLELGAGSFVTNLLAVASSLFAMQVWNRVVPARSINTLWVLALGLGVVLILKYFLRVTRSSITNYFGKKADLELSDYFYSRLLDIKNDARPRSPGSLIAQMRDFDQVRELLTSTTLGVLLDIPFTFVFIGVIALVAGWLALVPLVMAPLIVLPGLLAQRKLGVLSTQGMAEAALRNAILMESVYRVEDIKGLQAESRFRTLWHKANKVAGETSLQQRHVTTKLVSFSTVMQQLTYPGVVIAGVYGIFYGGLSMGSVIAASILSSRALAPLAQIPAVLARLQSAKVAKEGLDKLLALPVDHDPGKDRYHKPVITGRYQFEKVQYAYGPDEGLAIDIPALSIAEGDRIAVLGRTGAGKTTFLRLLTGMSQPQAGRILLDDTPLDLIDAADLRRSIGCLLQDSSLFYGSLRENLLLGAPLADDASMMQAMKLACADRLLLNQPHGMDLKLRESGAGLSGGQKQALMLARLILREPQILMLDEPTASLDETTEREVINNLDQWLGKRTLVVATHRYSILSIVKRIIVIDRGRIVIDAPRDEALARLSGGGNSNNANSNSANSNNARVQGVNVRG
ncbi:MAG: type I secretion system permease/ATPase [Pseudomonadales bacterium]|jgi:ATP-binding cassette subfamily C protein LapB|nr:type I secretion system permease/ATPase [Pseudomonadales bacterium]